MKIPALYSRVNCSRSCLIALMDKDSWMSMTQIAGRLEAKISPECAIRHYRQRSHTSVFRVSLECQRLQGIRRIVSWWTSDYCKDGFLNKKKTGNDIYFRLTKKGDIFREKESNKARQNTP
jgi:hypothetical protein